MEERTCHSCQWATLVQDKAQWCSHPDVQRQYTIKHPPSSAAALASAMHSNDRPGGCLVVRQSGYACGPEGVLWEHHEAWHAWMMRSLSNIVLKGRRL